MAYQFDDLLGSQRPAAKTGAQKPAAKICIRPDVNRLLIDGDYIHDNQPPCNYPKTGEKHLTFVDANRRGFSLDASMFSKHLLLQGGTGSGKTNVINFILESLLYQQRPEDVIVIFDTKGDYYRRFYQSYNPNHYVIGNSPMYASVTRHWNIFGELEDGQGRFAADGEVLAKDIAKELFNGRESDSQPFFAQAAADLVRMALIDFERTAAATGDRSRLNNAALLDWFHRARVKEYNEMIRRNPDFANAQLYYGDPGQGDNQRLIAQAQGVFSYINSMINDLFIGIFAENRPCGPFSMRSLIRNRGRNGGKTVIFVEYDLATGEVLSPMYRLLFDLALKEALGQTDSRQGEVELLIDEFSLLPRLAHISDAMNYGRSVGVRVIAGVQSINQIYDSYGRERGNAILAGFMNCFGFQTKDPDSREYLVSRFGENYTHLMYRAYEQPISIPREGHTLESWDIQKLDVGQAAIDLAGYPPFLFRFQDFNEPHNIY